MAAFGVSVVAFSFSTRRVEKGHEHVSFVEVSLPSLSLSLSTSLSTVCITDGSDRCWRSAEQERMKEDACFPRILPQLCNSPPRPLPHHLRLLSERSFPGNMDK
jgi:hypothetical protein